MGRRLVGEKGEEKTRESEGKLEGRRKDGKREGRQQSQLKFESILKVRCMVIMNGIN